jgi:hypothetical protein
MIPPFGDLPDAGAPGGGGDGGSDASGTGGAPEMGGMTSSAGGATAGTGNISSASGGSADTGGAAGSGGTAIGAGGMSAMSGGTNSAGGAPGAGGGCAMGQKQCSGACVVETAANGCSAMSCTACPIPAPTNGLQVCDAQGQCNFECLSGYQKDGNQCSKGTGGGGTSGTGGGGGSGGDLMCGSRTCHCFGNQVACCNKSGTGCLCVLPNAMNLCGP